MTDSLPQVNILLSAYNGERWLPAQLESLFSQDWPKLNVTARDDGSSDGTVRVLRAWAEREALTVLEGENIGFVRSFFTLVEEGPEAELYAFCDQDDVWLPSKLRRCVLALRDVPEGVPALCFTGYEICDEALHPLSRSRDPRNLGFRNSLADCAPLGCCTVFNHAARGLLRRRRPEHCCGHDWWLYMVCAGLGRVIYLPEPGILYRRHGGNVSAGGAGFLRFQLWRFKKFFLSGYFREITAQLRDFERLYAPELRPEDRELLGLFTCKSLSHQLRKAFWPRAFRQGAADEVFLRLCFLLGRL